MQLELQQRGRASMDFLAAFGGVLGATRQAIGTELGEAGLVPDALADDFDARLVQFDAALAAAPTASRYVALRDWMARHHGPIAMEAFDELRPAIEPVLRALQRGATTLERAAADPTPGYARGVAFHSTATWDGHDYMGFVHGELIHRMIVARNFGGDIYAQRSGMLDELRRDHYPRILELGTSSGNLTVALSQRFPKAAITGLDMSLRMLEQAQRVGNELGQAWRLVQRAAEVTGFEAASFDLVAAYSFGHEMPEYALRQILREARRVLTPGGELIIGDVLPFSAQDKLAQCWAQFEAVHGGEPYWREFCSLDMAAVATEEGFVEARYFAHGERRFPFVLHALKPAATVAADTPR